MLTQAQKYYGHDSSGEMTVIRGIMPEPPEPFDEDEEFGEEYQMSVFELTMGEALS